MWCRLKTSPVRRTTGTLCIAGGTGKNERTFIQETGRRGTFRQEKIKLERLENGSENWIGLALMKHENSAEWSKPKTKDNFKLSWGWGAIFIFIGMLLNFYICKLLKCI